MQRGVIYVAYGVNARREATKSMTTLRQHNSLPVAVVSNEPLPPARHVYHPDVDAGGRLAKLNLDSLSPFAYTLYLDADTRVAGDLSAGFEILADGWDMAIAPSTRQDGDALGNCTLPDRLATFEQIGTDVLALQCGTIFFRRCEAVSRLFAAWREEWARFKSMDQAAFLRALARVPVRLWVMGRQWNSRDIDGYVIRHLFGRARR